MRFKRFLVAILVAVSMTIGVPLTPLTPTVHAQQMFFVCDDPTLLSIWESTGYEQMMGYASAVCPAELQHAQDLYVVWCWQDNPNFQCSMTWWAWLYLVLGGLSENPPPPNYT